MQLYKHENKHYKADCECVENYIDLKPFINEYSNYMPYCRWCGVDYVKAFN